MLQEWHYFFENTRRWRSLRKITIAQVHGPVFAAGLMLMWACDLIVAAEGTTFADVVGTRSRDVRGRVLRSPLGVRPPQGQGAPAHGRLDDRRGGLPLGMVSKIFPADQLAELTEQWALRIARVPTMTALLIKEAVNQTVDIMGFTNALNASLLAAPDQPCALDVPQPRRHTGRDARSSASRAGATPRRSPAGGARDAPGRRRPRRSLSRPPFTGPESAHRPRESPPARRSTRLAAARRQWPSSARPTPRPSQRPSRRSSSRDVDAFVVNPKYETRLRPEDLPQPDRDRPARRRGVQPAVGRRDRGIGRGGGGHRARAG